MFKTIKNQSGFTFIESLLTTVVLGIGLWGSVALFHNATTNTVNNDIRVAATELASEKIETIIADKSFQGFEQLDDNNYPEEALADPFGGLTRSTVITEVSSDDFTTPAVDTGYKRIEVNVSWGEENYQKVNLVAIVSEYNS